MSMRQYSGRPMASVADQMDLIKPHVVRAAVRDPKRDTDQHTFILAAPPAWAALGRCVGQSAMYDEAIGLAAGEAAKRCEGCPVIAECLAVALAEEGGVSAGNRYTIRGGMSPKERAVYAVATRECDRGHVGQWGDNGSGKLVVCLVCKAEERRERYQERRLDPDFVLRRAADSRRSRGSRIVSCLECGPNAEPMRAVSLDRHLARRHGEEKVA